MGEAQQELTMKRAAFAIGLIAVAFASAAPKAARADFAIVQFGNGHCQIWWDSAANPWGDTWRKIAIGLPSWSAAEVALDAAISQNACP
jgi:hypothetical protein